MKHRIHDIVGSVGCHYCRGIKSNGQYCREGDHRTGFYTDDPPTVHLTERMTTWPGIMQALKLSALALTPGIRYAPAWLKLYRQHQTIRVVFAPQLHLRIPARYIDHDRAKVLAWVSGIPHDTSDRKRAFDWARRSSTQRHD